MTWRHCIDIDLVALRHNIRVVRKLAAHQDVIAVVKADAYGLGIKQCAPIYDELGVSVLAVAAVSEAVRIRQLLPDQRILVLGSLLPHEYYEFMRARLEIWVSAADEIKQLSALALQNNQAINVHLGIDTGMSRNGCLVEEAEELLQLIINDELLKLAGICTHYPQAYDAETCVQQEIIFDQLIEQFDSRLPIDCLIHRANSEGLLYRPAGPCNAVRIGLLLSGCNPSDKDIPLQNVLRWSSAVSLVKQIKQGQGVSYNHLARVNRDSRIAIIPVGYADGLPIQLSNRGVVLIHGHPCPILGQVTMDYIIVDTTDIKGDVQLGDEVVIIGKQGNEEITLIDIATAAQSIPYDILCSLRGRGKWTYHDLPESNTDDD